jgi:hypothetical protein
MMNQTARRLFTSALLPLLLVSSQRPVSQRGDAEVLVLSPYLRSLVTLTAKVEGREVKLLFDTGGGITSLSPKLIRAVGGDAVGRTVGYRMSGERIDSPVSHDVAITLGSHTVTLDEVAVFDVMTIMPDGVPHVDGVLALDVFQELPFTLDLEQGVLVLETEESLAVRCASGSRWNVRLATGPSGAELNLFVQGLVNEVPGLWFLFDSGNTDRLAIATHVAEAADSAYFADVGIDGEMDVMLTLDGTAPFETKARVRELILDGALSVHEIGRSPVTVDVGQRAIWIADE